ncbi:MAG: hypothetical protein JO340_12510 [Acidobacteriaceae bacterium]|nr:hypothetical protein [Acidobacteriaceae bacterium]
MAAAEKLLPEFDEEFGLARKFLDLVPDGKLTWKPHDKSMELGRLAWHIATFPEWCRDTFAHDTLKMTPEEGESSSREWEHKKRADMLSRFDQTLPEARAKVEQASDADMANHWKMEWAGQVIIDSPRDQVLRKWVFNHLIHHRAQLGVYYRLLGIAVPGSYGPSADEMPG